MRTNRRPLIRFHRFAGIRQAYAAGRSARLNAIAAAAARSAPASGAEGRGEGGQTPTATAQAVQTR
jgi:hypothetical protein